jgi:hypothetical protein
MLQFLLLVSLTLSTGLSNLRGRFATENAPLVAAMGILDIGVISGTRLERVCANFSIHAIASLAMEGCGGGRSIDRTPF